MLLNKTTGKAAIPVFWVLMDRWPTPRKMVKGIHASLNSHSVSLLIPSIAPVGTLERLLHPLGLSNIRAKRLIDLSRECIMHPPCPGVLHKSRAKGEPPTPISHLPGVGKYAIDSYRIFCAGRNEWKKVRPTDKPLCRYLVSLLNPCSSPLIISSSRNGNGLLRSTVFGRLSLGISTWLTRTTITNLFTNTASKMKGENDFRYAFVML